MQSPEIEPHPVLDDASLAFAGRIFQFASAGRADALSELFEQGLPANLRNERGDSLLLLAATHGQEAAARLILEAGGDPHLANDHGETPLAAANSKGQTGIVRLLLAHGARGVGPSHTQR